MFLGNIEERKGEEKSNSTTRRVAFNVSSRVSDCSPLFFSLNGKVMGCICNPMGDPQNLEKDECNDLLLHKFPPALEGRLITNMGRIGELAGPTGRGIHGSRGC